MLSRRKLSVLTNFSVILVLSLSIYAQDDKSKNKKAMASGTPVLWQDPGDISSRDLFAGPGGEAMKPDLSQLTFIKEETGGYSKKYRVRDGKGRVWVAKLSKEAQSETAATRIMWAIGYQTEIPYLVPSVTIDGKGTFENVKFEARPENVKRLDLWKWSDNPFVGTKEFQGLKVLMVLLENWDIKDDNNKILLVRNERTGRNELQYIISDLGATFGKTGGILSRTRNKPEDYAEAKFINEVKGNRIDFRFSGKRQGLFDDITIGQARWLGNLLAQLTDQQIQDAFRAANYTPQQVTLLSDALKARITELETLPQR
ncbi:MAG TPA: hypothetical protein VJX74_00430 [Blastocatellia bacterium]|nr:hypothetical protein [Blastocatellia bacterium]